MQELGHISPLLLPPPFLGPRSTRCQHARIKRWDEVYEKSTNTNFGGLMVLLWVLERRGKKIFVHFPPKVGTVRDGDIYINLPATNLPAWVPYQLACLGALPTCLPGCPTNLPAWVPHQLACLGAPPTCLPGCPTNLPACTNLPTWVPYQLACLGALPTCLPGCPTNLPAWVPHQLACLGALPTCLPGCPTNLPAWVPHQLACLGALPT